MSGGARSGNRLLDALPEREFKRIRGDLEETTLEVGEPLFGQGEPILHVHLPTGAVVSLMTKIAGTEAAEVATVGKEGLVGLPIFFGGGSTRAFMAICQIPGTSLRMPADAFKRASDAKAPFHDVVLLYTQALFTQLIRNGACARAHPLSERAACWLLVTHDRVGNDSFPLKQEFLSRMLGVRRPTVNSAARTLQEAGLIQYSRGRITVLDRKGLEAASCECYFVVRDEYARLLP